MHVNPPLGGGLQGTPANARVVPDAAELVLAQKVFGARSQASTAAASGADDANTLLAQRVFGTRSQTAATTTAASGIAYTFGTSAPLLPNAGDFWFKSDVGVKFTYVADANSSQWVEC